MRLGAGGVRLIVAIAEQLLRAVSGHAIEAAIQAEERARVSDDDVRVALNKELESSRYEASLAARRWRTGRSGKALGRARTGRTLNTALERVAQLEGRLERSRCVGPTAAVD